MAHKSKICWGDIIMHRTVYFAVSVVYLTLFASVISACQCSTKPRQPVNEIRQMLGAMAAAAEARSVSKVTAFLTDDFQGDGPVFAGNKTNLTRGIQTLFLRRGQIFVLPYLDYADVDKNAENAVGKVLLVATDFRIEWEELKLDVRADVLEVAVTLNYRDEWKVKAARWKRASLAYLLTEVLQQVDAN